jgi:hypothetical protein
LFFVAFYLLIGIPLLVSLLVSLLSVLLSMSRCSFGGEKKMSRELRNLCYNVPDASVYGEFTTKSIEQWAKATPLPSNVQIVDIGSGSGQTLSLFGNWFPDSKLIGFEISSVRAQLSRIILPTLTTHPWIVYEQDVSTLHELPSGTTHSISFDKTFSLSLMQSIEQLQYKCESLVYVITTKPKIYQERWDLQSKCRTISDERKS